MVAVSHCACIAAPRSCAVGADAAFSCAALTASISLRRPRSNWSRSASVNAAWFESFWPAGALAREASSLLPPHATPNRTTVSAAIMRVRFMKPPICLEVNVLRRSDDGRDSGECGVHILASRHADSELLLERRANLLCGGKRAPLREAVAMVDRELAVAQAAAPILLDPRRHQAGHELRLRMVGEIPVGHLVIRESLPLQ